MALTVSDLISANILPELKLTAGEAGVGRPITWFSIMDVPDPRKPVHRGELVFSGGYGLKEPGQAEDFLARLEVSGAAGLILQLGFELPDVPLPLERAAKALSFPLMTAPAELSASRFSRVLVHLLESRAQNYRGRDLPEQLRKLCSRWLSENPALFFSADRKQNAHLILVAPAAFSDTVENDWEKGIGQIHSYLRAAGSLCRVQVFGTRICCFLVLAPSEARKNMLQDLRLRITMLSETDRTNLYLSETLLPSPERLAPSVRQALEALQTLELVQAKRGICAFDQIEFLKVLGKMHQNNYSTVLDNAALQTLMNYDLSGGTHYTQTLRIYLSTHCNMTRTAQQLFLHRQTLIKRLKRISSITGVDLDDYYVRTYLSLALLFHDYFIY